MENTPKILIVEDNKELSDLVARAFKKEGYRVSKAGDGRAMMRAIENERIDLIVLDVMLPGEDGLTLCRNLRATSQKPVIIISAKGDELDRIVGLKMGADDYLPKPFSTMELIARVEAVLRRADSIAIEHAETGEEQFQFSNWTLDINQRELTSSDDIIVALSTGEFDLLKVFLDRPKRVLSREQLLDLARGRNAQAFDRSIDTQISRLRRKIEQDPRNPTIIKTVWGGGYVFAVDVIKT